MLVLAAGSAAAAEPKELLTAPDAILCLRADSLHEAGVGHVAKNQELLRRLGCLRSPAGVPATLLGGSDGAGTSGASTSGASTSGANTWAAGIWSVRYRPEGMSGGITMWGRPSAFTLPDGTPLRSLRAEK
jgi:hypothetical protein